jgi:uncharacterized repeat protein (TIGR03803 family)
MRVLPRLRFTLRLRLFVLTVAIVIVSARIADAQVAVDVVHGFPSSGPVQPAARLLRASNGTFYGTTQLGGAHNAGAVFSLAPDGVFTVLHEFDQVNGEWPNALIQASDGYLYGTTQTGGLGRNPVYFEHGFGTAFRISLEGSFSILHQFTNLDGRGPSVLIQGTDGLFYGTTATDATSSGTVFRMTPAGAVTTLHAFTGFVGRQPRYGVVEGDDGAFYGTTDFGGFGDNCGTVYRVTAAGAFATVHRFGFPFVDCHPVDRPQGPLILGPDGVILGATTLSIFGIASGTFIPLLTQTFPGPFFFGALTLGADGNLYSTIGNAVIQLGAGGPSVFHRFGDGESRDLNALIQAPDGKFYGTAFAGGAFGLGTVFSMTTSAEVTVLHDFFAGTQGAKPVASLTQANDGLLYGTNMFGGLFNGGTVFRVSTAGDVSVLHAFEPIDGITATNPATPVIQASSGDFYGTTVRGAFRLTPDGAKTTLTFPSSWPPTSASLVQANDGQLYGTTLGDIFGSFGVKGTVFQVTLDGNFTTLHSFAEMEPAAPAAELIQGLDGLLYGTGSTGGAFDLGAIFKMSLDGTLTSLHSFAGGAVGANPVAPLVQTPGGQLYGTTQQGGGGSGTAFKITTSGAYTQLHSFTGGAGGAGPTGKLVQAADGNFYGTTLDGGAFNLGTIFRMTPAGGFLVVHSFTGADGANPHAGLIQATDGHLYGTTQFGGPDSNGGVVYRVTLPPCTDTLLLTYAAGTLNLNFSLASSTPATFGTWLVHQSGVLNLWSVPVPAIAPAVSFNLPIGGFPSIGNVGVLTVLNAPGWASACYDWQVVDTGGAGASAEILRNRITRTGLIPNARR